MHKKLTLSLLLISSILSAKNSMSIHELAEHIKKDPYTQEKEKAVSDLKKAGKVVGAAVVGTFVVRLVMKDYEVGKMPCMSQNYGVLPLGLWIAVAWGVATVGSLGYAAFKGCQGVTHLLMPNNKPVVTANK